MKENPYLIARSDPKMECLDLCGITGTAMILSFRTDRPGLLEEQSDQGLHCLPFSLHCLDSLLYGRAT